MDKINIEKIRDLVFEIRNVKVILDSDVAKLYDVETKRINEAVKNNPDKFPEGYIFELDKGEWESLRSKFSTLESNGRGKHTKYIPKAFTEKGLYMLATILKSKKATQTTIAIIETFAKIRELSQTIKETSIAQKEEDKNSLMKRSGEIIAEVLEDDLEIAEKETTIEINFAILKFKHTIKKK